MSNQNQFQSQQSQSPSSQNLAPEQTPVQPPKKNKGLVIGLSIGGGCLVLIIILVVAAYFLIRHYTKKTSETLTNIKSWQEVLNTLPEEEPIITVPKTNTNEETQPEKKGKINQTISNEIINLTVNSFQPTKLSETEPLNNYEFYRINLTIKNNTSSPLDLSLYDFTLKNNKDEFVQYLPKEEKELNLLATEILLQPNETKKGDIIYEVRKDSKNLEFIYDDEKDTKLITEL